MYQLKTFVAVARNGSITRTAEQLHISQPAVSAHVKAIEDSLGLTLFERTARGMDLTVDGERLLVKAEQTLVAHQGLLEEATRIKGQLTGTLRLGTWGNVSAELLGHLLITISERYPEVRVELAHGTSQDVLEGITNGTLDAGFYSEAGEPHEGLETIEVGRFGIYLAAPPGLITAGQEIDWQALAALPWICPAVSTCCGQAAENLFAAHQIRPERIISIDREHVTRTLIAGGVGVGLLHTETAREAERCGDVALICEAQKTVRVLFASKSGRSNDPLLYAVSSIVRSLTTT